MTTKEISDSSKKVYAARLKKFDKMNLLEYNKIIEFLKQKSTKEETYRGTICAILNKLRVDNPIPSDPVKEAIQFYQNETQKVKTSLDANRKKNQLSEREEKQFIEWNKILEIKKKINEKANIKDRLLIALYTTIPPRRIQDYSEMIYISEIASSIVQTPSKSAPIDRSSCTSSSSEALNSEESNSSESLNSEEDSDQELSVKSEISSSAQITPIDINKMCDVSTQTEENTKIEEKSLPVPTISPYRADKNYLINTEKMIFNKYKTSKSFGNQEINLPNEIIELLTDYIKSYNIKSGDSLFGFEHTNSFGSYLKRLIGKYNENKGFSVDILRHSYVTMKRPEMSSATVEEMIALAANMQHSLTEELLYYKKTK